MIKKIKSEEDIRAEQKQAEEQEQIKAMQRLRKNIAEEIVKAYKPTRDALFLERDELGAASFIGRYSINLNIAINRNATEITCLAQKLADKTIYELNKKAPSFNPAAVKIECGKLKTGTVEQSIFNIETPMLVDRAYTVYLEEPVKQEPDNRENPMRLTTRITREIAHHTKAYYDDIKNHRYGLTSAERGEILRNEERVLDYSRHLAGEALIRLASKAVPLVGNITDTSGIEINYNEQTDELTLSGIVVGEHGKAEVSDIPVEFMGKKWRAMNEDERRNKFYKVKAPIVVR